MDYVQTGIKAAITVVVVTIGVTAALCAYGYAKAKKWVN